MAETNLLDRIIIDPNIMVGKPVIKGTRLTVEYILKLLAYNASFDEIMEEYQGVTAEDIRACLLFATRSLESNLFMPLTMEPA